MKADGDKTAGGATTVHSPTRKQRTPPHGNNADDGSTASSDPRLCRDQRQVLDDRRQEDARTAIERRRETRRQSDHRAGTLSTRARPVNQATCRTRPAALRSPASCGASSGPARRISSPTYRRSTTARRTHRNSSVSTQSLCKLPGGATRRYWQITSRSCLSRTFVRGLCTCRKAPFLLGQIFVISLLAPSRAATNPTARRAISTF